MDTTLTHKGLKAKILKILVYSIVLSLSIFVFQKWITSIETYKNIISALDEKRNTVFSLVTASAAVSTAITVIPSDVGTPIAQQVAEMSSYFIVVLSAIFLEKYLLTILGYLSSCVLIPASCVLGIVYEFKPMMAWLKRLAVTLFITGIAIVLVVPTSVWVSNKIEETFHCSIQNSINAVVEVTEQSETEKEDSSVWGNISKAAQSVIDGVSTSVDWAKTALRNIIESIAILLVTDCLIPVVVILFFVWLVKQFAKALYARPALPPREEEPHRFRG